VDHVKSVLAQDRVRVIGVCFGHQIVARALGTPVGQNDAGWEVSVLPLELSDEGKRLFKQDKLVSSIHSPKFMMKLYLERLTDPGLESLSNAQRYRIRLSIQC
jgi:GMP synthase-like glutamine amidotransferase